MPTVAEYVVDRLADLGIDCVFGVPGDFSFPFDDAIDAHPRLKWVVCANELNAAYAADGYARIKGASILSTTYGVGELSALNGVMGARAQRLPVFHIVGAPSTRTQRQRLVTHHTLGDGVFNQFSDLSAAAACVVARLTPDNAIEEMERVIREAFRQSAPAYISVPMDLGKMPVIGHPPKLRTTIATAFRGGAVAKELDAAVDAVLRRLKAAGSVVALPTVFLATRGLAGLCAEFLAKTGIPYATTTMDKGVLSEENPGYLGLYNGLESSPRGLQQAVEEADLVLDIGGVVLLDFNTAFWTSSIDPKRLITIGDTFVRIGDDIFTGVPIGDVLRKLTDAAEKLEVAQPSLDRPQEAAQGSDADPISSESFYPRLRGLLKAGDVLIGETGTCLIKMASMTLPEGVGFQSQTLWGSIGWATPATLGVALAKNKGRTILVTGDGSHQLTANEIGVMGRYGVNPIIFVLNNGIYGVEDVLSELGHAYDDLAQWNYHLIPQAMGCDKWFTAKVATIGELKAALQKAADFPGGCYIEVMIPADASQPLPAKTLDVLYKTETPEPNA